MCIIHVYNLYIMWLGIGLANSYIQGPCIIIIYYYPLHVLLTYCADNGNVVLESVQYRGQHVGVLPNGTVKEPGRTGTGQHAQFRFIQHSQPPVCRSPVVRKFRNPVVRRFILDTLSPSSL